MLENFFVFTTIAEGINTRFAVVCLSAIVVSTMRNCAVIIHLGSALRTLPDAFLFGGLTFWVAINELRQFSAVTALILDLSAGVAVSNFPGFLILHHIL